MAKKIDPNNYTYNRFPGPTFFVTNKQITSDDKAYIFDIVTDYKTGLDADSFGKRFSPLMLKYDYIVGDWAANQLRLRGFYKDKQTIPRHMRISRLEDYLTEYCHYGCAYFVLENHTPQDVFPKTDNDYRFSGKSARPSKKRKHTNQKAQTPRKSQKSHRSNPGVKETAKKHQFTIRKK